MKRFSTADCSHESDSYTKKIIKQSKIKEMRLKVIIGLSEPNDEHEIGIFARNI